MAYGSRKDQRGSSVDMGQEHRDYMISRGNAKRDSA